MIGTRGLLLAFAGVGLALQGCSSPPPPPPAPPPMVQVAPPDFSGTYTGKVMFTHGCRGPGMATLTVQNKTFTLPWNKAITFTGPVADDGSISANVMRPQPRHPVQKNTMTPSPAASLSGKIDGDSFTGEETGGRCNTPLMLKKTM